MGEDLRNTLIVSKDKTQYDLKAKKILARESVLSYILASTVDEYNIAHEDAFRKELIELCNLSEGILEQGEVRGRTKEAKESA